jgi:hypothetical protein
VVVRQKAVELGMILSEDGLLGILKTSHRGGSAEIIYGRSYAEQLRRWTRGRSQVAEVNQNEAIGRWEMGLFYEGWRPGQGEGRQSGRRHGAGASKTGLINITIPGPAGVKPCSTHLHRQLATLAAASAGCARGRAGSDPEVYIIGELAGD